MRLFTGAHTFIARREEEARKGGPDTGAAAAADGGYAAAADGATAASGMDDDDGAADASDFTFDNAAAGHGAAAAAAGIDSRSFEGALRLSKSDDLEESGEDGHGSIANALQCSSSTSTSSSSNDKVVQPLLADDGNPAESSDGAWIDGTGDVEAARPPSDEGHLNTAAAAAGDGVFSQAGQATTADGVPKKAGLLATTIDDVNLKAAGPTTKDEMASTGGLDATAGGDEGEESSEGLGHLLRQLLQQQRMLSGAEK
jgi:hypothetical protein